MVDLWESRHRHGASGGGQGVDGFPDSAFQVIGTARVRWWIIQCKGPGTQSKCAYNHLGRTDARAAQLSLQLVCEQGTYVFEDGTRVGAHSVVRMARHAELDLPVAIKFYAQRRGFEHECELLSSGVSIQYIPKVYQVGNLRVCSGVYGL